jgi:hypothetical protein
MTTVLAQNSFGDTQPDGIAGPLGLFVIVLLVVATVLLIRNMNKRIKRLPEEFPPPPAKDADSPR